MASVNKVILVGNLGRDPEIKVFPSGDQVANVTVATTDRWKDKQTGEQKENTEWHRVVFNGRLAEIVEQYLRKGSQVYVEGSLRTRKWTDQAGVEKYSTEIRADQMQMLGARQDGGGQSGRDSGYDDGSHGQQRQQGNQQRQQPQQRQAPQGQQQRGNGGFQQQRQAPQQQRGGGGFQQQRQAPQQQRGGGGGSGFDSFDDGEDIPFATSDFSFDAESKLDRRIRRAGRTRREM